MGVSDFKIALSAYTVFLPSPLLSSPNLLRPVSSVPPPSPHPHLALRGSAHHLTIAAAVIAAPRRRPPAISVSAPSGVSRVCFHAQLSAQSAAVDAELNPWVQRFEAPYHRPVSSHHIDASRCRLHASNPDFGLWFPTVYRRDPVRVELPPTPSPPSIKGVAHSHGQLQLPHLCNARMMPLEKRAAAGRRRADYVQEE